MSIGTKYRVICDHCRKGSIYEDETIRWVVKKCHENGWVNIQTLGGRLDLCPECKNLDQFKQFKKEANNDNIID